MKEKKRRGCSLPVLILILILGGSAAFALFVLSQNPEDYQNKSVLASELDLTTEQENSMLEIFSQCGIGEITSASKFQDGEGHTSYHLKDEETDAYKAGTIVVWVNNTTKAVESIFFQDEDIYLDGTVVAPITNYYVNSADRDSYRVSAQLAVNKLLNYPDTAKYPAISGWRFGIEEGVVIVQSSVTAKNALDVESTSDFQAKFTNGTITSLILDGTEYIK